MLEARRSTMRLHAAQHNSCTPVYQPNPNNCLLNTVKNQSDQIGLIVKMADQGIYTIFVRAVMFICDDPVYGPRLSNCWLPAATWVETLQKRDTLTLQSPSMFVNLIRQCLRRQHLVLSCQGLMGQTRAEFSGSNTIMNSCSI